LRIDYRLLFIDMLLCNTNLHRISYYMYSILCALLITLHFMARFSCHEYRLCIMPNAFKLSFSVYGCQVIEAYLNLVRHLFRLSNLFFPWWFGELVRNHMSLIRWFWPFGWMPFGLVIRDVKLYHCWLVNTNDMMLGE